MPVVVLRRGRENINADTYFITVQDIKKSKYLGGIPVSKDQGFSKEGLNFTEMKKEALSYYEGNTKES